jgi:aflatoxin B1 aldehyde reductase
MTSAPKSNLKVIFGTMTFGKPGVEMSRVTNLDDCKAILDVFQAHGHKELDSARVYAEGSCEEYLGELDYSSRGLVMDTKLYPSSRGMRAIVGGQGYDHTPEGVRKGLKESLSALKVKKIAMFYLHGPDRKVDLEDTLREVNALHEEGYFEKFGISNYMSWEVARICEICRKNGWIMPTVYQGLYNAFHRRVEDELVACLRFYGMSLYIFNPLAGGFLTSRYQRDQKEFEKGSRFDPDRKQGALFHGRYWNDFYFDALDILRPVANKHGLTEAECALRWLNHHSALKRELGDGVIVGASSTKHLEENLKALDEGPLPEDVVEALDEGWAKIRGMPLKFWH